MILMELELVSWYSIYPRKASLKVSSRYIIRKLAYHQSLFLESGRTWRFLMDLEMVEGV